MRRLKKNVRTVEWRSEFVQHSSFDAVRRASIDHHQKAPAQRDKVTEEWVVILTNYGFFSPGCRHQQAIKNTDALCDNSYRAIFGFDDSLQFGGDAKLQLNHRIWRCLDPEELHRSCFLSS